MHASQIISICESLSLAEGDVYESGDLVRITEPVQYDEVDPNKAEGKVISRVGNQYEIEVGDGHVKVDGGHLVRITEDKGSDDKYDAYKAKLLKKHGFKSWADAAKDKDFMAALDKGWNADDEAGDDGAVNEAKSDSEIFGDLYDGVDYYKAESIVNKVHKIFDKSTYKPKDDVTKTYEGLSETDQQSVMNLIKSAPKR